MLFQREKKILFLLGEILFRPNARHLHIICQIRRLPRARKPTLKKHQLRYGNMIDLERDCPYARQITIVVEIFIDCYPTNSANWDFERKGG